MGLLEFLSRLLGRRRDEEWKKILEASKRVGIEPLQSDQVKAVYEAAAKLLEARKRGDVEEMA